MRMPGRKFWIPLLLLAGWFGGRAWYFTPSVGAEEYAPDFAAVRADGQEFSLKDLRGQYVLLDFWGSWCGPCRRESPALVALHQQYGEDLTIVSVAIERDSSAWHRARTRDQRTWPHQVMDYTSSFKFLGGQIAGLYGIKQVPTNLLLAPDHAIIEVNVPLEDIPPLLAAGASGVPTSHPQD